MRKLIPSTVTGMLLALAVPTAAQQTGTITGIVTGASGVALAAAQVYLAEAGIGALTNQAGRYLLLNVPAGTHEVRVELVGHRDGSRTVEVTEGAATVADFVMAPVAIDLDEIVVTGVGRAAQKRQLGNTVATLDAVDVGNAPVASFSELLQGREPSVTSFTSDGATGSGARIRIRGSNSISMSNEPIVYVDGVRVDNSGDMEGSGRLANRGSRLDDINWEAVERVEILKGAAAATLYGSEASSGVIQVFTKGGRAGDTRVTARAEYGALSAPDRIPGNFGFAFSDAHAEYLTEVFGQPITPFAVFGKDFTNDILETGRYNSVALDVSGGSDDVRYYLGGRYSTEDGILGAESLGPARDDVTRYQGNAGVTVAPRSDVSIRVSSGFTGTDLQTFGRNNDVTSPTSAALLSNPAFAHCFDSSVDSTRVFGATTPVCTGAGNPTGSPFSTVRELMQVQLGQDARHFFSSIGADWAGGPGMSAQLLAGFDQVDEDFQQLFPYGWSLDGTPGAAPDDGLLNLERRTHREITLDGRVGWSSTFGQDVTSDLVVGGQRFSSSSDFLFGTAARFPAPGVDVLQAAEEYVPTSDYWEKVSLGGFVQEQVGFRDWIFGTLGGRFDRTSAFGTDAETAFYPKVSVSALVSELSSWPSDLLPSLRVRAAWGRSGLQPGAFDRSTTYAALQTASGGGIAPANLGNPELRPERATEIEFGVDGTWWDGRVGFDLTYWDRVTEDALIRRGYPAAGGFSAAQLDNIGRVDAHGLELRVNALVLDRDGLTLNLSANGAYLSEQVKRTGVPPIPVSGSYTRHRNVVQEGLAPGAFVGARLIPTCAEAGDRTCYAPGSTVPYDLDGDGVPDTVADLEAFLTAYESIPLWALDPMLDDEDGDGDPYDHVLGKPTPDWQGSFGAELSLGSRVSVSTTLEYRAGSYSVANLTDAFRNASGLRNSRLSADVESTLLDPSTQNDAEARAAAAMTWATELASLAPYTGMNLVEPGDFIRWRELTVTYRLPERLTTGLRADDLTVSLTGRNLGLWTRYSGIDPEGNELGRCGGTGEVLDAIQCNFLQATPFLTLPLPRRIGLSIRAVF